MKIKVKNADNWVCVTKKYPWLIDDFGCTSENGNVYIEINDLQHLVETLNKMDKYLEQKKAFEFYSYSEFWINNGVPTIFIHDDYIE